MEVFLDGVESYGVLVLGLAMFLASGGAPNPAVPLVIAAGALAEQHSIDPAASLVVIFCGIVLGDTFSYGIGRFAGDWLQKHMTPRREAFLKRANNLFERYGPASLFITHAVVTSLDVPSNMAAGLSRFSYRRFIVYVLGSRLAWLLFYWLLGYLLGSQWEVASDFLARYSIWLGLVVVLLAAVYLLVRRRRNARKFGGERSAPGV